MIPLTAEINVALKKQISQKIGRKRVKRYGACLKRFATGDKGVINRHAMSKMNFASLWRININTRAVSCKKCS